MRGEVTVVTVGLAALAEVEVAMACSFVHRSRSEIPRRIRCHDSRVPALLWMTSGLVRSAQKSAHLEEVSKHERDPILPLQALEGMASDLLPGAVSNHES